VPSGRHAIYIFGLSVFWKILIALLIMLQALVSRRGSNCMENTIITLSAQRSLSGWGL
jgi:hypothetical protein